MNMRMAVVAGLLSFSLCLGSAVQAQEKKEQPDFMELMKKFGTPGPEHKNLEPLVGQWDVTVKMFEKPGESPKVSKGTSNTQWMLDKRYIGEHFKGNIEGMSFEGMGLTGYDRYGKKYVGMWVDSMSTGFMTTKGTYDAKTKTFTFEYVHDDPYMGKKMKCRDVVRILGNDEHVSEMYRAPFGGGDEFKIMEIRYVRAPIEPKLPEKKKRK